MPPEATDQVRLLVKASEGDQPALLRPFVHEAPLKVGDLVQVLPLSQCRVPPGVEPVDVGSDQLTDQLARQFPVPVPIEVVVPTSREPVYGVRPVAPANHLQPCMRFLSRWRLKHVVVTDVISLSRQLEVGFVHENGG